MPPKDMSVKVEGDSIDEEQGGSEEDNDRDVEDTACSGKVEEVENKYAGDLKETEEADETEDNEKMTENETSFGDEFDNGKLEVKLYTGHTSGNSGKKSMVQTRIWQERTMLGNLKFFKSYSTRHCFIYYHRYITVNTNLIRPFLAHLGHSPKEPMESRFVCHPSSSYCVISMCEQSYWPYA